MLPYLLSVVTALGWVGAIVGLIAYLQVSRGLWAPNSLQFQLANLTATSLMFLVAAVNGVWPSVAANIAWMVIGAQALLVINKARRARRNSAAEPAVAPVGALGTTEPVDSVDSVLAYLDELERSGRRPGTRADRGAAPVPAGSCSAHAAPATRSGNRPGCGRAAVTL